MTLLQRLHPTAAVLLMSCLFAASAFTCELKREGCVEIGKWELSLGVGAGLRTNPLEATPDIPLVLIPQVNYNGERFFIQNLDFGFILWESDSQQLNLFATPSYDQVYFHRWNPSQFFINQNMVEVINKNQNDDEDLPVIGGLDHKDVVSPSTNKLQQRDLRDRRTAGLCGFEYNFSAGFADLQLQYVIDFTEVHAGNELRLLLAKYWASGRHQLSTSIGAIWQSNEVVHYYYGLTAAEADERGTYDGDAALTPVARLDWNYQLTERWDLRFLANYRQLPDEISASPLVNDNKVITVFIGGVYHF